jgi:hypothetical protein
MSTLTATPAQIGAAFARKFIGEVTDPCHRGVRHPILETKEVAWYLARYGNHPEFWHMAMIQLMVRARNEDDEFTRVASWHQIGRYLLSEASPSQLQDGVLWHFTVHAPVPWMVDAIKRLRCRLHKLESEQLIAA